MGQASWSWLLTCSLFIACRTNCKANRISPGRGPVSFPRWPAQSCAYKEYGGKTPFLAVSGKFFERFRFLERTAFRGKRGDRVYEYFGTRNEFPARRGPDCDDQAGNVRNGRRGVEPGDT